MKFLAPKPILWLVSNQLISLASREKNRGKLNGLVLDVSNQLISLASREKAVNQFGEAVEGKPVSNQLISLASREMVNDYPEIVSLLFPIN